MSAEKRPEAKEIEITPEKIDAEAKALAMFNYEFESFECGAERICRIMASFSSSESPSDFAKLSK